MARLYSNENFPQPVVKALLELGHDVLTSSEAGNANKAIPDEEVLRYATSVDRAVITFNRRHFHALHARQTHHAGIITCTLDADYAALTARIHTLLSSTPSLAGQLIKVIRPRI